MTSVVWITWALTFLMLMDCIWFRSDGSGVMVPFASASQPCR